MLIETKFDIDQKVVVFTKEITSLWVVTQIICKPNKTNASCEIVYGLDSVNGPVKSHIVRSEQEIGLFLEPDEIGAKSVSLSKEHLEALYNIWMNK